MKLLLALLSVLLADGRDGGADVAVCFAGQIRSSLWNNRLKSTISKWSGLGTVDYFLALSFEETTPTINHGGCPATHDPRAVLELFRPQPKSYRFYNGTTSIASSPHGAFDIEQPASCKRPVDWTSSSVLCKGDFGGEAGCMDDACTHCDITWHMYVPHARTHACLRDVVAEEGRRGFPYRYVVATRPDFKFKSQEPRFKHGVPVIATWNDRFAADRVYAWDAGRAFASDPFFLFRRELLTTFLTVRGTFEKCQSRAKNIGMGLRNDSTWPRWYFPEGVMVVALRKHGVGVETIYRRHDHMIDRTGCEP